MKIKPNSDFSLLGTGLKIKKGNIYNALPATNQPEWREKGKIFVEEILLEKGEYEIVAFQ